MPIGAGDRVIPEVVSATAEDPVTEVAQPAIGVVLDEPGGGTVDVLWENGFQSTGPILKSRLRKLKPATEDETDAGQKNQVVRLSRPDGPQESVYYVRAVLRGEPDAIGPGVEDIVLVVLEQLDRNGAFSGSRLLISAGAASGAEALLQGLLVRQPPREWPRY